MFIKNIVKVDEADLEDDSNAVAADIANVSVYESLWCIQNT